MAPAKSGTPPSVQPPLLVLPRPFRDLFEKGEPKKSFSGSGVFLLNLCGEPSFCMSRRETDESLERTSGQGRCLTYRLLARTGPNRREEWKMPYLFEVSFAVFISQCRVEVDNQISSAFRQHRWRPVLRVLDVLLDERYTQYLHLLLLPSPRG